jgi:mono/diheme cytochrome c family protein
MKRTRMLTALAGAALVLTPLLATAQKPFDLGKREYESNCAVCHGATGKGDGPYMKYLAYIGKGVGDLTLIAKRNGGAFPFQRVYEQIDGTQDVVEVHGPRDMPIWGKDYGRQARDAYPEESYAFSRHDLELYTRTRILALTDYLNRIQVK